MLVALIVPVVDCVLGLARPDEHDRDQKHEEVFDALSFAFPVPGVGRRREARPAGPALLRALPRRGRPLAAARGWTWLCLVASLGGTIALATWLERRRAARAAAALGRLPAPERRPALARGQGSTRQRSPSKSDVTQAEPAAEATASGLCRRGSCARPRSSPGRPPRPCCRRCSAPRACRHPRARERVRAHGHDRLDGERHRVDLVDLRRSRSRPRARRPTA